MERVQVDVKSVRRNVATVFQDWMLLTCGENAPGKFNAMTIGWGFWGFAWSKPIAIVLVRHQRYTYEFMEKYGDFSICSFGEEHRGALSLLGTKSGRDGDKIGESGLTPVASKKILSPSYEEANFVVECRKIHASDLGKESIFTDYIQSMYNAPEEYHKLYFGEIVSIEEAV
ncbi:MAG: flavin reductase [Clostridiales bacterium]|nr:flavin reductase [Clostridiales bacterium]